MVNKTFSLKLAVAVTGALGFIAACSNAEKSPDDIFQEYYRKAAAGLTVDEEKAFFSARKQQEMASRRDAIEEPARTEVAAYIVKVFECSEIKLAEESISAGAALLTYNAVSICEPTTGDTVKLRVPLVDENGWKIDDIEIVL